MPPVVPKCLALILCDAVRRGEGGVGTSIVNAFDIFEIPSAPAVTKPFSIWLQVTDGNGATTMRLVIEHVLAGSPAAALIVPARFTLDFRNPNSVLEHVLVFDAGIGLPQMGRYRLRLTANGTTIAHRYFVAAPTP